MTSATGTGVAGAEMAGIAMAGASTAASHGDSQTAGGKARRKQFCTFFLRDHFFGVPVERVQEVIRYQEMTRVPLVPKVIRGLINLRGQIVMAIDLRRRFGMEERLAAELPMNVVVRTDDGAVSFLVDEIGDVLETDADTLERPPETLRGPARELIAGVYKLQERLMLVLDTERAVQAEPSGRNGT